jgi:galacturan 1,4-alpha-galacturonidase
VVILIHPCGTYLYHSSRSKPISNKPHSSRCKIYTTSIRSQVRPGPGPTQNHNRYYILKPSTFDNRDHARAILDAFYPGNNRYTIVFISAYPISSPLDLAILAHVDVVITGQIHFNASEVYYWAEHGFKYKF